MVQQGTQPCKSYIAKCSDVLGYGVEHNFRVLAEHRFTDFSEATFDGLVEKFINGFQAVLLRYSAKLRSDFEIDQSFGFDFE